MKLTKIVLVLCTFALFSLSCGETNEAIDSSNANANKSAESSPAAKPEDTVDELASGRKVYSDYCVKCHKEDGTGGKVEVLGKVLKAENFTSDHAKKESDEEFIEHIRDGITDEGMPSFKETLSEDEIKSVVNYIRKELQK